VVEVEVEVEVVVVEVEMVPLLRAPPWLGTR